MNQSISFYQIKDFAKVKGGKRLPKGFLVQDTRTEHPYIRVTDMRFDGLNETDIKYLPEGIYEEISKYTISNDDIYISIAGTVGLIGKIPYYLSGANLTENSAKLTELNTDLINQDYLIYFLRSRDGQFQIKSRTGGSSQPKLALNKIETIEVPRLPISQQSQIATIITNYDKLIENNEKRIKILEEMAQRLYTEWFVKFKFPGHEKVKMVDSGTEFGLIPEEWDVKKLDDVTSYIGRGISPKYDDSAVITVINQKCIRNNTLDFKYSRKQSKQVLDEKLLHFGDVLINSTGVGTLGRVTQVYDNYENCTVDSHISILRFLKSDSIDYLGMTVLNLEDYFTRMGAGATGQTELSRITIQNTKILYPPLQHQKEFSNMVSSLKSLVITLLKQNKKLSNIRDLLIPQLVTGKKELNTDYV